MRPVKLALALTTAVAPSGAATAQTKLHTMTGHASLDYFGFDVAGGGDVDGDGVPDAMAGGYRGAGLYGHVKVISGATGSILHAITGPSPGDGIGAAVAFVGDLDGDGKDELAATGLGGGTWVWSGASGALLHQLPGGGHSLEGLPDVTGDGVPDIQVGDKVYSGQNGQLFRSLAEADYYEKGGDFDGDGDGYGEVVLGHPWYAGPSGEGEAYVYSYDGPLGARYCTSTATSMGEPSLIGAHGSTSIAANDLVLTASDVEPGQPGLFFYGTGQTQTPFGNGFLCVTGSLFRLPPSQAAESACLVHELDYTSPPSAAGTIQAGSTWNFQTWFRDPAAGGAFFDLSDGLSVTFLP